MFKSLCRSKHLPLQGKFCTTDKEMCETSADDGHRLSPSETGARTKNFPPNESAEGTLEPRFH
ncbi:MAG: hypothetical protein LBS59_04455 [Puniceicoccales bacterium]|nr:hypothetical protein [Puniceicoccales bacterium]